MAAKKGKKGQSPVATLINGAGFLVAVILVLHAVFVLVDIPSAAGLESSVAEAAVPLSLFFPGLVDAPGHVVQVLLDFGLAAGFWLVVAALLSRLFG